jgi:MYXO-CTERM domain-containing protein
MRHFDFRRLLRITAASAAVAIAGITVPAAISAQDIPDTDVGQEVEDMADGDQDWGWVGLLGLAGLLGLRRRDRESVYTTDTSTSRRT